MPEPPQEKLVQQHPPVINPLPRQTSSEFEQIKLDTATTPHAQIPLNLIRGNPHLKKISLTFDGGSEAHDTEEILDILDQYHVKSTFFLTGMFRNRNLH